MSARSAFSAVCWLVYLSLGDVRGARAQGAQGDESGPRGGFQLEGAIVSNSIWRGAALWTPRFQPGVTASADARIEDWHGIDFTTGAWLATPLHLVGDTRNRVSSWLVPSAGATYWLSDQLYTELAYSVYLQPAARRVDYQHDVALVLGYRQELRPAWELTLSAECDADPVRRKGAYLHGDVALDYNGQQWGGGLTAEIGASRYTGADALAWGLQAAMLRVHVQRAIYGAFYVRAEGVLAFSEQTAVWHESRTQAALSLSLGVDLSSPF
ncbi:MAG TPA: hypothetical protein VI299_20315 [Polyangiales bacterium]